MSADAKNLSDSRQKYALEDAFRFDFVLEGAGLGAWDWWIDTNAVYFDRRWCEMLGLTHESTPQLLATWDERVHPEDKDKAYADLKAYLDGKTKLYENIHRLRHENGSWVWVLDRGRISERGPDGRPVRFTGTHLDITQYKNAEELNESIQEMAKIGGWELDVSTMKTTWTKETYRIHGLDVGVSTDAIMGIDFYAPHERARITKCVKECIKGTRYQETFEFIDALGQNKWVEAMGEPVFDAFGKAVKLRGSFQDITARKVVELEIEKRRAFLDAIIYQSNDPMMTLKANGSNFTSCNKAALELFGIETEEKFKLLVPAMVSPEFQSDGQASADKSRAMIQMALLKGSHFFEWDHQHVDGRRLDCTVLLSKIEISGEVFLQATVRDMSDYKETKASLEALIHSLDDLVFEMDDRFCVSNVWVQDESKLFLPKKDFLGKRFEDVLPKDICDKLYQSLDILLRTGESVSFEYQDPRTKSSQEKILYRGKLTRQKRSSRGSFTLLISDITKEKMLEEQRLKAVKELEQFFDVAAEMLCIAGTDGVFRKVNSSWEAVLGFTEEELSGRRFLDFVHPDDIQATLGEVEKLSQGIPTIHFQNRYRTKDGDYKILSWATSPDPETGLLYAAARDVTDLALAEESLRLERIKTVQNAKLASLGEMSAGIAHEINNPLAIISGTARALHRFRDHPEEFRQRVETIEKASERIGKIVGGLRKFSRTSDRSDRKEHKLSRIVEEAMVMTGAKARRHSTEIRGKSAVDCMIFCDEIEIEQVLVNLINNGIDAVKNESERWVELNVFEDKDEVVLQVRDSGPGMGESSKSKLFQPFFTTKPVGQGTGLGLAIVKGIIEDHKASISLLDSDQHTCFEIRFKSLRSEHS